MTHSPQRRRLQALAPTVVSAACATLLLASGPPSPVPPLRHPGRLGAWAAGEPPGELVAVALWFVAVLVAGYVSVVGLLLCLTLLVRRGSGARLVERWAVPALRHVAPGALGAAVLLTSPAASASTPGPSPVTPAGSATTTTTLPSPPRPTPRADALVLLPDDVPPGDSGPPASTAPPPSTVEEGASGPDDVVVFAVEPDTTGPPATTPARPAVHPRVAKPRTATGKPPGTTTPGRPARAASRSETAVPTARPARPVPLRASDASTWTTRPGDHLWGIAATTVGARLGRPATAAEVAPYWQRLIDTNRHRLADPGNPDLIFPGQVFDLPG